MERFLVVDVETTGLYNLDRVVEVAAVTVSPSGEIVDEWDSLVNPGRDIGPTHLHGVTASMVSAAPRFEEVAEALAARVDGSILVAHNLAFDSRMLGNEYARLGAELDPGRGVCTLLQCRQGLADACAAHGIALHHHHRALADARATALLLFAAGCRATEPAPAVVGGLSLSVCPRTLRREAVAADTASTMPYLARLAAGSHHRTERGASLAYLDMLDWALHDLAITEEEWLELGSVARNLGMTDAEMRSAHERYLRELLMAAGRDNVISEQEHVLLVRVAEALRIDRAVVEDGVRPFVERSQGVRLQAGMSVCFTGAAICSDGSELPRGDLERTARALGLRVVEAVTRKGCDLVVAADPSSLSGKASKARAYGIPIVDVQDFVCAHAGAVVPSY